MVKWCDLFLDQVNGKLKSRLRIPSGVFVLSTALQCNLFSKKPEIRNEAVFHIYMDSPSAYEHQVYTTEFLTTAIYHFKRG